MFPTWVDEPALFLCIPQHSVDSPVVTCSECGESATRHDAKCWLGPSVKLPERYDPEDEIAYPGFAILRGPPLTFARLRRAVADADQGDQHVPESIRPRYRSMVAVLGQASADNWLSFRVDESGNLRE